MSKVDQGLVDQLETCGRPVKAFLLPPQCSPWYGPLCWTPQDSLCIAVRFGHRGNSIFSLVIAVAQTPAWLGNPAHKRTCNSLVSPVHGNKSVFILWDWQGLTDHI